VETTLSKPIRWLAVFIVTLVVCMAGSAPVFATSLFVQEVISYPLTLLVMGILAPWIALTAALIIGTAVAVRRRRAQS